MSPLRAPVSIPVLLAVSSWWRDLSGRNNLGLVFCAAIAAVEEDGMDEGLDTALRHDGSPGELEQLLVVKQSELDTPWEHSLLPIIPERRSIQCLVS